MHGKGVGSWFLILLRLQCFTHLKRSRRLRTSVTRYNSLARIPLTGPSMFGVRHVL